MLRGLDVETLRSSFSTSLRKRPCGSSGDVERLSNKEIRNINIRVKLNERNSAT
jgi:hypothetical protein